MLENISSYAYFAGWRIVRWMPEKSAYSMFNWISLQLIKRNGGSVKRLRSNLERVQSQASKTEIEQLLHRGMASYMRYWCDTFRFPDWSRDRIISSVTVSNEELLIGPMQKGQGVIVALPHAGNWDHAGAYFCAKGFPLVTVAERLKPEALFQKFLSYRQKIGMEVLSLDSRSIVTLLQRAREGRLIALVADRDLTKSGIDVRFFDGKARMPAGPALIAVRTGTPLISAYVSYSETGIHIDFKSISLPEDGDETARIAGTVQLCADSFEESIAKYPQDWHMLQRIWVDRDFKERS